MATKLRWVLVLVAAVAMVGCGGGGGPDAEGDNTTSSEETPAESDGGQDSQAAGGADDEGSDGDTRGDSGADVRASIQVRGGQPRGGVQPVRADVGDTVALTVTSDVADTVHVHGYDLEQPVGPGSPTTVRFTADIPGVFEVELEQRGVQIAELTVGG